MGSLSDEGGDAMHEAAIAAGILEVVSGTLADRREARLTGVRVRIGRLAGVLPDCLTFAWEVLREGTAAGGVPLRIEEVPVTARCRSCGIEYDVPELSLICPRCGGLDVEMLTGRELEVTELEVEEGPIETGRTP
jgi:hydrogenase nickel incorporation protein HypA/HybF